MTTPAPKQPAGSAPPLPVAAPATAQQPPGVTRGPLAHTSPGRPPAGKVSGPARQRRRPSRTPEQLRAAMALAIIASLVLAGVGLAIGLVQSARIGAVAHRTTQIVSLMDARSALVRADATATNAFLIGGLEPAELRADYDSALQDGTAGLAALSALPEDPDSALSGATAAVARYAGLVEQARANNRQGFPVGSAFLGQASQTLENDVLPQVDTVVVASANASASDFNAVGGVIWLLAVMVASLAVLVWIQIWLSRRTRRTFNVPMAVGSGLALLATIGAFSVYSSTATSVAEVRNGSYRATLATSQALSLAGEARSDEAFTLIRRGSGGAYETSFGEATTQAGKDLARARAAVTGSADVTEALNAWIAAHQSVRDLDDGGDWDAAVALATSREAGSPTEAYQAFVSAAQDQVTDEAASTARALDRARRGVVIAGWTLALLGVVAAGLCWRGLDRRLEEYR